MKIVHKLEMDLAERGAAQRIDVVQGDCNTRILELTLLCSGEVWEVPEGTGIRMRYCKSDGTKGIYDTLPDGTSAWKLEGNVVSIALAPQMLTASGMVVAQVVLVKDTAELAAFSVQIRVEHDPSVGVLESEDYLNMLQWMEKELDRLLTQARDSGEFDGPQGQQGPQGPQGESAEGVFEYAADAGYTGTEAEFRDMLITPSLPLAGGTMLGAVDMGGQTLSGLATPKEDTDAVTKAYVDKKLRRGNAMLRANGWSSAAPYTQNAAVSGVTTLDWIRLEPAYTGTLETDLQMKEAWECVSYAYCLNGAITVVCLEQKPTTSLTVGVQIMR